MSPIGHGLTDPQTSGIASHRSNRIRAKNIQSWAGWLLDLSQPYFTNLSQLINF